MFMKIISKEKDVNSIEERRQAEALNREFYLIDPKDGIIDVRIADELGSIADNRPGDNDPEADSYVSEVIAFLAEKSADRFDYMADGIGVFEI